MSFPKRNKNILLFIRSVAFPLLIGLVASLLTRQSMQIFATLNKPPLSPPSYLFPIVWTILYTLMGISSYIVTVSDVAKEEKQKALQIYNLQLVVNFLWPTFFFNLQWYVFSFIWLVFLWILVFKMLKSFSEISKTAMWINIPYLVWLTFAGYLNLAIFLLN